MNYTLTVPEGSTNHGNPNLLCVPPKWSDYIVFFVANYLAHAFTLISRPGEHPVEIIFTALNALFVPSSGALRALRGLYLRASLRGNELERAARAGALCTVVKTCNISRSSRGGSLDAWRSSLFGSSNLQKLPSVRTVHGRCKIPVGYALVELPFNVPLRQYSCVPDDGTVSGQEKRPLQLANTYNIPKILVGLFQAVWGAITLYKSRGDQIDQYGIAAFGLSVAPYVFMSVVNIMSALVTPEYPTMYLVHCPDMDEIIDEFDGIIADIVTDNPDQQPIDGEYSDSNAYTDFLVISLVLLILTPIMIVGGLSRCSAGNSSGSDRGWMMSWLVMGAASSIYVRFLFWLVNGDMVDHLAALFSKGTKDRSHYLRTGMFFFVLFLPLWVPAIGGMITVGHMLQDYGICTRLDD